MENIILNDQICNHRSCLESFAVKLYFQTDDGQRYMEIEFVSIA